MDFFQFPITVSPIYTRILLYGPDKEKRFYRNPQTVSYNFRWIEHIFACIRHMADRAQSKVFPGISHGIRLQITGATILVPITYRPAAIKEGASAILRTCNCNWWRHLPLLTPLHRIERNTLESVSITTKYTLHQPIVDQVYVALMDCFIVLDLNKYVYKFF